VLRLGGDEATKGKKIRAHERLAVRPLKKIKKIEGGSLTMDIRVFKEKNSNANTPKKKDNITVMEDDAGDAWTSQLARRRGFGAERGGLGDPRGGAMVEPNRTSRKKKRA